MEDAGHRSSTLSRELEEFHQALCRVDPDPVDVFEDALARELGVERPSGMGYEEWRRYRVRVIERLSAGGGTALATARAAVAAGRTRSVGR